MKSRLFCESCGRIHLVGSMEIYPKCPITRTNLLSNSSWVMDQHHSYNDRWLKLMMDWLIQGEIKEKNKARLGLRQDLLNESESQGEELFSRNPS